MIEENKIVFKESRIFHATSSLAKWQQPLMPSFWKKIIEACLIYPSNEANQQRMINCWFITHLLKLVLPEAKEDCFLQSLPRPIELTSLELPDWVLLFGTDDILPTFRVVLDLSNWGIIRTQNLYLKNKINFI